MRNAFRKQYLCVLRTTFSSRKIVSPAARRHERSIFSLPFVRKNNLQFDNQNKKPFQDVIYSINTLPYTVPFLKKIEKYLEYGLQSLCKLKSTMPVVTLRVRFLSSDHMWSDLKKRQKNSYQVLRNNNYMSKTTVLHLSC